MIRRYNMKKFFLILILIPIFQLNVFAEEGLGSLNIETNLNNFDINEAIVGTMTREDGYVVPISLTSVNNYKTLFKIPVGTYEKIELSFSKIETEKKYTLEYTDSIIVKEDQKSEFEISVNENTGTSEVTATSTSTSTATSVEDENEDNNSFRISIVSIVVFLVIILVLIIMKIRNKE
jgi:hypothetical protein